MSEKCISSLHIQKLGHEILEIRERALLNINSKLEHGYTFDNDLARSKEILTRLFEWFLFTPCTKQQLVFSLIKRILQSDSGQTLIKHHGSATFKKELQQLRTYIEPKYYEHLEEILRIIDEARVVVPPLETDVPLSYRTGQSEFSARPVGTTATTIEGFIEQESSYNQRNTPPNTTRDCETPHNFLIDPLRWQFLIEADRHVLQSVENSLKNPPQPASLLDSADFFTNILLHDFPAEVFLQRPNIVYVFQGLISDCPSTRVVNSVLECLIALTKALQVRINYHTDPCLYTTKVNNNNYVSPCSTPDSTSRKTASGQSDDGGYENVDYLKTQQISFPRYCFSSYRCVLRYLCVKPESIRSVRRKNNQKGVNLALDLLDELLNLLGLVLTQDLWRTESRLVEEIRKEMNDTLIEFGATLEYYRIEATSDDVNINNRVTQLCLLHNCANFLVKMIPISQTGLILPRNLKNALVSTLVDVILSKLYPNLYNTIFNYVQSFKVGLDSDSLVKYRETQKICDSMTAAVEFMAHHKTFNASEGINLAKTALPSLEFHKDLTFVKYVIELCANKLPLYPCNDDLLETFEFVVLKLLSHNLEIVREETYKLCQKRVIAAIGPRLNTSCTGAPGAQILFLCRSKILVEVACHGMSSENPQVRNHSEDILIHIIKCKILVTDEIWNKIVVALIGCLPILLCHSGKNSSLGRSLLNILDPDTGETLNLPKIEVVKGNIHLLFGTESSVKEEAFSRLCWLLAAQKDSREMLPRLNNLYDKALPNVCQIQRIVDINKNRSTQHFYQPSSLQQVLDLLQSPNVEPVIRRSALTQISVMLEDPLLHSTFLSSGGLHIVLNVMKSALVEKNFSDYPDSVIPIVSILKNVCLFQASARHILCDNIDVYYNILRSLFMFFTEDKIRQDAVSLLFLLIFSNFVKGTPSKANFSIPYLVSQKLQVPFSSNTHWEISQYYDESLVELLISDKWCLSSLQIQWNCEIFDGLDELLSLKDIDYSEKNTVDILKLREYDLMLLKTSNIDYCTAKYLSIIQNGTVHDTVIETINKLTTYVHLCSLIPKSGNLLAHPWEGTFSRFLKILPSSEEDAKLLGSVLQFLKRLAPFYKSQSEPPLWLTQLLKNPSNCVLDLIMVEQNANEDFKALGRDLSSLITVCASQEQHFLDYYTSASFKISEESWRNVICIIANILKFNDNTHFYNLAYLDSLLCCLATLTASLGWTNSKPGSPTDKILFQLVSSLCELVVVFHCGKGPTAAVSVMGLSITRNVILILNHLVAEMQNFKLKNWESCFMEIEEADWMKSFLVLWSSRDVFLRAGALKLFAGLAVSPILAISIVNELKNQNGGVWNMALSLLLDNDEASIVRESCGFLLGNLSGHTELVPNTFFEILEDFHFFKNVYSILSRLYTVNIVDYDSKSATNLLERNSNDSSSSSSKTTSVPTSIVTPSLVRSIAKLLLRFSSLNEDRLSYKLQDFGVVKILFRCVCNPAMNISDTKKLSLYCDILEMDIAICMVLSHVAYVNYSCLGTLLHTRDCLTTVVSLLNPSIYDTHLPQLLYLRNKLWSEIFKLLTILTTFEDNNRSNEALKILGGTIEEAGRGAFVETLCEAAKNSTYNDLQSSALLSLTSLLGSEKSSMQNILDSPRTDRSEATVTTAQGGAELCKILLNLYDLCNLQLSKDLLKKKSIITASLTSILCVSQDAKRFALNAELPTLILKQFKDFHIKLSLESVDCLRRVLEKKRVCPILKELNELVGLVTNFMVADEVVKNSFAELGLSDFVHKLWVWFALQNNYLVDVLKMLCTFTTQSTFACQSLPMTSSVAGSGPRKVPSKISLLHVIINLVEKEMDLISKTHSLNVLNLSFAILKNCCAVLECRVLICKSTLLNNTARLHPAITKKQKPWDLVELLWLEFLEVFTLYPEGQSSVAKISDVFDLIVTLTSTSKVNKTTALTVLRNIAFYQPNRSRLLTSDEFLNLLQTKLENGSPEEKSTIVLIMWSLAANNQKAKIVFKAAKLDARLQQVLRHYQLSPELTASEDVDTIKYVLSVIRDEAVTS